MVGLIKSLTKLGLGIVLVGGAAKLMLYKVDKGHRAVIFDRFQGVKQEVIGEGIHFKIPWLHFPIIFDVRAKSKSMTISASSKDLKTVNISVSTLHRPKVDFLPKIFLYYGPNYQELIVPSLLNEVLKNVVGQFNASELNTKREIVTQQTFKMLTDKADQFDILFDDITITQTEIKQDGK